MPSSQPHYRGVACDAIIESLQRTEAYIRDLEMGPASAQRLDEWLAGDPYTALAQAQTDLELVAVMRETGSDSIFRRLSEIFRFNATVDEAGMDLLQDLGRWGAFDGMEFADYRPTDAEQDIFLLQSYVMQAVALPETEWDSVFDEFITELEQAQPQQVDDYKEAYESFKELVLGVGIGVLEDVINYSFANANLRERHLMKELAHLVSGQAEAQHAIRYESPMGRYGVVYDGIPERYRFDEMGDIIGDGAERLVAVLEPFYELNEVDMTGMGFVTGDFKHSGLVFDCTKRVAELVAAAFPERQVMDYSGNVIEPPQNNTPENGPEVPKP